MTAPNRPPRFFNSLSGEDTPYPDSLREPRFLLDDLTGDARHWPNWLLDDDSQLPIRLELIEHASEQKAVIGFTMDGLSGTISLEADASGYLLAVVRIAGDEVLRAYVERVWEEHELWPPGATAAAGEESPGQLGKHRTWISMSTAGWPMLASVANAAGWLNLKQVEEPVVSR